MATRALVGFITDGPKLISTYNHYDGYPNSLGVALDKFYSMPEEALKIANMGYISYINAETGEIEAKHKEPADKTDLGEDFEEGMMKVAQMGDSYGADYIYIYNVEELEWIHVSLSSTRRAAEELAFKLQDYDGGIFPEPTRNLPAAPDQIGEDYNTKWKKFINETEFEDAEGGKDNMGAVLSQAMFKLQGEPKHMLQAYQDSLANDIRLNGQGDYVNYTVEDFIEDYDNYIADKMDM